MIVKIQQSLFTNAGHKQMLIYDQSRRHEFQGNITPEIQELMGDKPKVYAKARLIDDPKVSGGKLFVIDKVLKRTFDW